MPLPRKIFKHDLQRSRLYWYRRLRKSLKPRELRELLRVFGDDLLKQLSGNEPEIKQRYVVDLSKASKEQKRKAWAEFQQEAQKHRYYWRKLKRVLRKEPEKLLLEWRSTHRKLREVEEKTLNALESLGVKYSVSQSTLFLSEEYFLRSAEIKSEAQRRDMLIRNFSRFRLALNLLNRAIREQQRLADKANLIHDVVWIEADSLPKNKREKAEEILKIMSEEATPFTALYDARKALIKVISQISGALGLH